MPEIHSNDKPLTPEEERIQVTGNNEGAQRTETFSKAEDDPHRVDNRGGMEAVTANEADAPGRDDDSTVGLVAPAGQPGGEVGPTDSRSGATDPQVEVSAAGLVDASVADLGDEELPEDESA